MPTVLPDQVHDFAEAREECDTFQQIAAEAILNVLCLARNPAPMLHVVVDAVAAAVVAVVAVVAVDDDGYQ